ncbi:MAG: rhodanese-like domain-containing protein [Desulfobacterales bacterium]|nr:rhodanese-like domain-containing protein [Desulfobacterales bacterium]
MNAQIEYYENKLAFEIDPADLYDSLRNREGVIVIDTRQPQGFEKEHIPGAVNLPHKGMTVENTRGFDRSKTYVCYCDGIGCNASTKGALNMARLGFKVKELMGGIQWWKLDGYATEGTAPFKGTGIDCGC